MSLRDLEKIDIGKLPLDLRDIIREELNHGTSLQRLVELVLSYKESGGTQRDAYDQLHKLWLEFRFDDDESNQPNPKRDELEYLMELVWGFCSSDKALWETSLSGS